MTYPELDNLFNDLLATNRGPGYGVKVRHAVPDLSLIEVELRFIAGRTYCCSEPGCHLPYDKEQKRLHQLAEDRSLKLPQELTIHWHCCIEEGAKFEVLESFGLPIESKAQDFEVAYGAMASG